MRRMMLISLAAGVALAQAAAPSIIEKNGDLYRVSGNKTTRLTYHGGNSPALISPDGRYAAYFSIPDAVMKSPNGPNSPKWDGMGLFYWLQNVWLMDLRPAQPLIWRVAAQPSNFSYSSPGEYDHFVLRENLVWSQDSRMLAWIERLDAGKCRIATYQPAGRRLAVFKTSLSCLDNGAELNQLRPAPAQNAYEFVEDGLFLVRPGGLEVLRLQPPGRRDTYRQEDMIEPAQDPRLKGDTLTFWIINSKYWSAEGKDRKAYEKDIWKVIYNFKTRKTSYSPA